MFPKDEYFTELDVETSSPQVNDEIGINSSWYKVNLTWELIGYWLMVAF